MKKLRFLSTAVLVLAMFLSLVYIQILWAAPTPEFTQAITAGTLGVDVVDASGTPVGSPSVTFAGKAFSFDAQNAAGTLGVDAQRVRLSNPTATATWTVAIAATGGTSAVWTTGSFTYPYNAAAADDGRLTVNPSAATIAGVSGCATTDVSAGSSAFFLGETTVSITLMSAGATAATGCRWDLTNVSMEQRIPASQSPGNYTLGMTITAS